MEIMLLQKLVYYLYLNYNLGLFEVFQGCSIPQSVQGHEDMEQSGPVEGFLSMAGWVEQNEFSGRVQPKSFCDSVIS